jgi:hypothetical protein
MSCCEGSLLIAKSDRVWPIPTPGHRSPDTLPLVRSSLSPGGVERPRRVVRFARLIHRCVRAVGVSWLPARGHWIVTAALKPSIGCADHLTADSFRLSMTLDRMGVG